MIGSITIKRMEEAVFALPLPIHVSLEWIVLKIKALSMESTLKVNKTIIENTRASIQQHNDESRREDLQRAVRRSLEHKI